MPPKSSASAKSEQRILIVPSRVVNQPVDLEGEEFGEETEIAAQVTVPHEGGWGWVVVAAAFATVMILDGVAFTFGSVFEDITDELEIEQSLVAIINAVAITFYYVTGPLVSALINRFGFRAVTMTGSVIVSLSLFCTYFSTSYAALIMFYGVFNGFGYCFINMASGLVVGFYFEKLRSLALSITTTGSSVGIMVMYPINAYLVKLAGWRTLTLLHSGMFGLIYFFAMTFRPLLSVTVTKTTNDPTRTVTFLPIISTQAIKRTPSRIRAEGQKLPTVSEKLFSAVSNMNFPTAAAIVKEDVIMPTSTNQPGSSGAAAVSKLTLTAHAPRGGISQRQLKQVQSIISRQSVHDKTKRTVELTVNIDEPIKKKRNCCGRLFHWEEHVPQSRPMYRDDVFFDGKLEKLPLYQKSVMDTAQEARTGLEYQLAVSRAVTTVDLQEHRGVFTTACRRILATMMDPKLLKRRSFLLFGSSGFMTFLGFLVPYVFIQERNKLAGIDESICTWFVSVIGFANLIGRLVLGALTFKVDPVRLYIGSSATAGIVTILSDISYNVYYQFAYCAMFGFFISSVTCLRSIVLVQLYGLEKLTNATGMMLLFQGFGCSFCTPAASVLKGMFGFNVAFYIAGICIFLSGICLLPVQRLCKNEDQNDSENTEAIVGPKPSRRPSIK